MSKLTQKALSEALLGQLKTKQLDRITVTELTDECGLARNTFYYYFKDVYDLLSYTFTEELARIRRQYADNQNWEGGLEATINYLYMHRQAMHNIYQSIFKEFIVEHINAIAYEHAFSIIRARTQEKTDQSSSAIIARFYSYALLGALTDWLAGGLKTPPEVLARTFDTLFVGTLPSAVEAAREIETKHLEDLQYLCKEKE